MVINNTVQATCPKCGSKMHRAGFAWSGSRRVQRYRCGRCGATTIRTTPEEVDRE